MELLFLFVIPLLAGVLILWDKKISERNYKLMLALSGAFVLGMCFNHLLPHSYHALIDYKGGGVLIGTGVILGFIVQVVLEWLTGGVEHGHIHHNETSSKFPYGLLLGLCLHAFIEGLPLNHVHDHDHHFLMSILVHKFPVALILIMFLKGNKVSNLMAFLCLLVFACMSPLGLLCGEWLVSDFITNQNVMHFLAAAVIGILLHIGTTIIFESSENHAYNARKLILIIIGFSASYLSIL